jgi:hypothetical protein
MIRPVTKKALPGQSLLPKSKAMVQADFALLCLRAIYSLAVSTATAASRQ